MADYLKSFADGEAIIASETNDNNQYLLNTISTSIKALKTEVEQIIANYTGNFIKPGFILPWPTDANAPAGYLICDGSSLLRADSSEGAEDGYADLFAVIGTIWGAEDDYHFNLPPFNNGAYLRCTGGNAATLGLFQSGAIPNITGNVGATVKGGNTGGAYSNTGAFAGTGTAIWGPEQDGSGKYSYSTFNASRCSSLYQNVNEVRTDNYAVNWIIKY